MVTLLNLLILLAQIFKQKKKHVQLPTHCYQPPFTPDTPLPRFMICWSLVLVGSELLFQKMQSLKYRCKKYINAHVNNFL